MTPTDDPQRTNDESRFDKQCVYCGGYCGGECFLADDNIDGEEVDADDTN